MDARLRQLQEALDLKDGRNLSYRQIGEVIGCSAKTAHKRVQQARDAGLTARSAPVTVPVTSPPSGAVTVTAPADVGDPEAERARQLARLAELEEVVAPAALDGPNVQAWRYARLLLDILKVRGQLLGVHRPPDPEDDDSSGAVDELMDRLERQRAREEAET